MEDMLLYDFDLEDPSILVDIAKQFIAKVNDEMIKDRHTTSGAAGDGKDVRWEEVKGLEEKLECINCGAELFMDSYGLLFCSGYCRQVGKFVRYVRASMTDGRCDREDVLEAIGVRLLFLRSGGYPEDIRKIPDEVRRLIFERDGYTCQICGAPATEIDHIFGSSNHPDNLRAVCRKCNLKRVEQNVVVITPETNPEEWERLERLESELAKRVAARVPYKVCDDEKSWQNRWRKLLNARRKLWKERYGTGIRVTEGQKRGWLNKRPKWGSSHYKSIWALMDAGYSYREIASKLGVSKSQVKWAKTVRNRFEAVWKLLEKGETVERIAAKLGIGEDEARWAAVIWEQDEGRAGGCCKADGSR